MESEAYDIDSLSSSELSELLELKIETEEFLNNKYNVGFFYVRIKTYNIQLKTCDIYLTSSECTKKEDPKKVGKLTIEPLNIKIWIPEEKEYP